jgi:organic radical activating enzyme
MKTFWNWDIHYACNYRCSYCFLAGKWDTASEANRYPGIDKWIEVWGRIYEKYGDCHIHFSGGEPFMYPNFFEFISYLSNKFTLEFTTNLTFDVPYFIKKIKPESAKLNLSFHPEFADFDKFLKDTLLLKRNKFSVYVSFVAYPPHLKMMSGFKNKFNEKEIDFIIQLFRGNYGQQTYPDGYTELDKDLLKLCGAELLVNKDIFDYHLKNKQEERKLCRMGQAYGKIYASADVHRCCSTGVRKIGNLLNDADFALLDKPEICEIQDCICWRRMVVGEENKWLPHWQ